LSDDIFKKLKSILSGSTKLNTLSDDSSIADQAIKNEELVNNFMNQILDSAWVEEDLKTICSPSYQLSTINKEYWLMNTTIKSLLPIKGGIEIFPLEKGKDNTLCLIGQSTYSIPNDLIICIGWN